MAGSTVIITILLFQCGIDFRRQNVHGLECAERVINVPVECLLQATRVSVTKENIILFPWCDKGLAAVGL